MDIIYNLCSKCKLIKPSSEFYKDARNNNGLRYNCKMCTSRTPMIKYRNKNKKLNNDHRINQMRTTTLSKTCSKCHVIKSINEFNICRENKDSHHNLCKLCYRLYRNKARANHSNNISTEELNLIKSSQRTYGRNAVKRLKLEVLSHYSLSTIPICADPYKMHNEPITDIDILTLDHINGGGSRNKEIRLINKSLYRNVRKEHYPEGYQVLCCNCQSKKRIINHESGNNRVYNVKDKYCKIYTRTYLNLPPKEKELSRIHSMEKARLRHKLLKHEALLYYSYNNIIRCVNPFFLHKEDIIDEDLLQIDHINGGGNREQYNDRIHPYNMLKRENYPLGFQVLCANCNFKKRITNKEQKRKDDE
jgi:hypothetical protein